MNKKLLFLLLVAVVALVITLGRGSERQEEALNLTASPSPTPTVKIASKAKGTAPATLTYTQAVEQYAGKRIQFNQYCQGVPNYVTYQNGTNIMLDNRSGDARTIKVGATAYSLAGYGFRIVTLSSATLPATLLLSCGSAVNVGQILLQK